MHVDQPAHPLDWMSVPLKAILSVHLVVLLGPLVSRGNALVLPKDRNTSQTLLLVKHLSSKMTIFSSPTMHGMYLSLAFVRYTGRPVSSSICIRSAAISRQARGATPPPCACALVNHRVELKMSAENYTQLIVPVTFSKKIQN